MAPEFPVQERPDPGPLPPLGVGKIGVERKIPLVKAPGIEAQRTGGGQGKIEQGDVEKGDVLPVPDDEIEGPPGGFAVFRGGPEEQINVRRYPRFPERPEGAGGVPEIDPLFETVQHPLVARFETQLEHGAAGAFQGPAEIRLGKTGRHPREAVPGNAGRVLREGLQEPRVKGVIQEVDEDGVRLLRKGPQVRDGAPGRKGKVGVSLRPLGAEETPPPVAPPGGAVREDRSGGEVGVQGKILVIRKRVGDEYPLLFFIPSF